MKYINLFNASSFEDVNIDIRVSHISDSLELGFYLAQIAMFIERRLMQRLSRLINSQILLFNKRRQYRGRSTYVPVENSNEID